MFYKNVYTFKNFPVQEKQRKWTDCCCTILTAIFALSLFILACILFHRNNYYKVNYPVDDSGKTCGYDLPNAPLIYFKNPKDITKDKRCVKQCPFANQNLKCDDSAVQACKVLKPSTYSTVSKSIRLGLFCMPTDETLNKQLENSSSFQKKSGLMNSYDIILLSLLFGLLIGIIYLLFMILIPKIMVYGVFILASIVLLILGILFLAKPIEMINPIGWNILIGIGFIIFGISFLIYLCCYRPQIQLASIFMFHANNCLKQTPKIFIYIPIFLVFTVGLLVLCLWQFIAFGTAYQPQLKPGKLYYSSSQSVFLQILNLIELIWGLQFLRDAFNFVISGNAIQWYFKNQIYSKDIHCQRPFMRLLCKNWGSVAGGSFLNAFFSVPDMISDMFRCNSKGSCGKCQSFYKICCFCNYLFELVRTDAYAYINLSGVPYCNAARQCQSMCQYSQHFGSSQSCLRLYRIAAHIFLVILVALISLAILFGRTQQINTMIFCLILFLSYCTVTYFVDIHADASQGLMVCYLSQSNCQGQQQMFVCPPNLRNNLYQYSRTYK